MVFTISPHKCTNYSTKSNIETRYELVAKEFCLSQRTYIYDLFEHDMYQQYKDHNDWIHLVSSINSEPQLWCNSLDNRQISYNDPKIYY